MYDITTICISIGFIFCYLVAVMTKLKGGYVILLPDLFHFNMTINIIAFGIAKDIIGGQQLSVELEPGTPVGKLKDMLCSQFPDFMKLRSLSIAVNEHYRTDDFVIGEQDEVVIIPPVSGG